MNNNWNKVTSLTLAGFILLFLMVVSFYFVGDLPDGPIWDYLTLAVALVIVVIALIYVVLVTRGKITQIEPDYRAFFMLGIIFLPISLGSENPAFLIFSLIFIAVGLINKKKWKEGTNWSKMTPKQRNIKLVMLIVLGLAVLLSFILWYLAASKNKNEIQINGALSEQEARAIAEATCIKGGEALASGGTYNPNSKTWWFDANLNATQPGCNPACVVSADTKIAEINWRCIGLIMPEEPASQALSQLFIAKYPQYAATLAVTINQETENHIRGSVIFETGAAGGIFLAAKTNGAWQVVHEGNGQIPCSLSQYGFPAEMLTDCAS